MPGIAAKDSENRGSRQAFKFLLSFFFLVVGFTFLIRLTFIDENLVLPYTQFISWFTALLFQSVGIGVESSQTLLRHPDFTVDIRRGCDGIVATLILVSALIAYPSPWKSKFVGVFWGYILIFFLNLVRVIVLFSLGILGWMDTFNFVHTYIAQFVVIACAMLYWIFWAGRLRESFDRGN
jgi:exosortase/archaeosortase family protein